MKNVIALVGVAGLASAAMAQSALLNVRFSTDGGATWQNSGDAFANSTVTIGVFLSVEGAYGVGGATYNVTGDNMAAGDSIDIASAGLGRQLPWTFGAATQAVYTSGSNFRVDAANDAGDNVAAGIASTQRDPSSAGVNYSQANPGLVYKFNIVLGSVFGREMHVGTALNQIKNGVIIYHSSSSATRGTNTTAVAVQGSTINVVPTPASMALVGLGGLVGARRRRR